MSLKPEPVGPVPEETVRVAKAAFPKGNVYLRIRDELGSIYKDEDLASLFPSRGQPALAPWRLALVTVLQFKENLTDRQAAEAVRARIDVKYLLGLALTDPGFHYSVLSEFRQRLVEGQAEQVLLDKLLERFKEKGWLKASGKQRSDSTHVLAQVRVLNRLGLVGETLRAALNELAREAPEWLRGVAEPEWFERYGKRVEDYRLPKGKDAKDRLGFQMAKDGFRLLAALEAARVEGANLRQLIWRMIIPLMWPSISVALMFRTIFSFKVFDKLYLLTGGGPGTATEVASLYIYKVFFSQNRLGYGALLSVVTIFIICTVIFFYRRINLREA